MTDSIYNLSVRMALEGVGVAAAASMLMRQFRDVENSARSMSRTVKGMNLNLSLGDMADIRTQSNQILGIYSQMHMAGQKLIGQNFGGLSKELLTTAANVDQIAANMKKLESEIGSTTRAAETLSRSLSRQQIMYPDRGIPGVAYSVPVQTRTRPANVTNIKYAQNMQAMQEARDNAVAAMFSGDPVAARKFNKQAVDLQMKMDRAAAGPRNAGMPGTTFTTSGIAFYKNTPANRGFQVDQRRLADLEAQRNTASNLGALEQDRLTQAIADQRAVVEEHTHRLSEQAAKQEAQFNLGQKQLIMGSISLMAGQMLGGALINSVKAGSAYLTRETAAEHVIQGSGALLNGGPHRAMTDRERTALETAYVNVGTPLGYDMTQMADIALAMTQLGVSKPSAIVSELGPLTQFAFNLQKSKGTDPTESAHIGYQFAHLLGVGAANTQELAPMLDLATKAILTSPVTPQQFLKTMSYIAPRMGTLYGINKRSTPQQRQDYEYNVMEAIQLQNYLGQQTRGGQQFGNFMSRIVGLGTGRSANQMKALAQMEQNAGMTFFDPNTGKMKSVTDILKLLNVVAHDKDPKHAARMMQVAFGQIGGQQANLLAGDYPSQLVPFIKQNIAGMNTAAAISQQMQTAPEVRFAALGASLKDLNEIIGMRLAPSMSSLVNILTRVVVGFSNWMLQHQKLTEFFGFLATGATVVATVAGAFWVLSGTLNIMGKGFGGSINLFKFLLGSARLLWGVFGLLVSAIRLVATTLGLAGAEVAGGASLFEAMGIAVGVVVGAFSSPIWGSALLIIGGITLAATALFLAFKFGGGIIAFVVDRLNNFVDLINTVLHLSIPHVGEKVSPNSGNAVDYGVGHSTFGPIKIKPHNLQGYPMIPHGAGGAVVGSPTATGQPSATATTTAHVKAAAPTVKTQHHGTVVHPNGINVTVNVQGEKGAVDPHQIARVVSAHIARGLNEHAKHGTTKPYGFFPTGKGP